MLHLRRFLSVATVAASLTFLLATSASSAAAAAAARPVRLGEGVAETTETATAATKRKRKQKRRALGSKGSKGSKGSSKGSKGSKGGKGKGGGKGRPSRPSSGPRTIYETVEFVVFSTGDDLCGSREDVAPGLESAFLKYWEEEAEECDSDRDVETAVLTLWEEAPSCSSESESESESKSRRRELEPSPLINGDDDSQGRRLQNTQQSRGRFNRRSSCSRCRRRLIAEEGGVRPGGPFDLHPVPAGRTRRLSKGSKGSKGGGKGGSSKGSKGGGKGGGGSSKSCSVDPVDFLIDAGFEDVYRVRVTSIEEADCYDHRSKDCTSTKLTRGACCGMCGCACSYPSESLCEAEDYCVGGARPFEMDFCEDFVPDGGEEAGTCKKESCDDDGNGSKDKSNSK